MKYDGAWSLVKVVCCFGLGSFSLMFCTFLGLAGWVGVEWDVCMYVEVDVYIVIQAFQKYFIPCGKVRS